MSDTMTIPAAGMEQIADQVTNALERIFAEIAKPCRREEMPQRIALCRRGLELVPKEINSQLWAILQTELADSLAQTPAADRAASQEEAIAAYRRALTAIDKKDMPDLWRRVTVNLANVLSHRLGEKPARNLEEAITLYVQALDGLDADRETDDWATIMSSLASAYTRRVEGAPAENIEQAIAIYDQILPLRPRGKDPVSWAHTAFNLALAYLERIRGDRAENLERARCLIEETAEVLTRERDPWEWAVVMNSLANVYAERIRGSRQANLEHAIQSYGKSLEVWTRESEPFDWAMAHNNLGTLYLDRIAGDRGQNLELARQSLEQALTIRKRATSPFDWAATTHNLANVFKHRVHGNRAENLERAIELYGEALGVRTREDLPVEWAATIDDLADAYSERILGDRAENLERAIELLQGALEIRTRETMPQQWALTSNKLGIAYLFRVRGDENDNLETAIATLTPVLEIWTRESNPSSYAETSVHLGHAYYKLDRGGRRSHMEQAIRSYKDAAEAVTRDDDPTAWALAMLSLGNAYQQRVEGTRAENLEESIRSFDAALTVLIEPFERARTLNNLANSLRMRSHDLNDTDRSHARALYQEALQVLSLEAVPADHLQTQTVLGRMEFDGQDWEKAHQSLSAALAARDLLYAAGATTESRQHALAEAAEIPAMDACCLARLGRAEEGVEVLERSRARSLRETLARNEAALEQAAAEHREQFIILRHRIAALEAEARAEGASKPSSHRGFLEISRDLGIARQDLAKLSEQIRSYVPGFMPVDLSFPEIAETASFSGLPIVYLVTSVQSSLALIVPPAGAVRTFWLPDFTRADLDALLFAEDEPRYLIGSVLGDPEALKRSLDAAWSGMGKNLIAPLSQFLAAQGWTRAALVATGTLDLLPLSAMASPEVLFTPIPSARALSTACRAFRQRSGLDPVFLGIGDPRPSPEAPLPSAVREIEAVSQLFPATGRRLFLREQATREAVTAALRGATHLHFACHGRFNPQTPLDSALVLSGEGRLTLRDFLDGGFDLSGARIVVLSACQSGIKDYRTVPDEVAGFPAALLQAGVPGVLSTLWPVNDLATDLLLTRFYKLHLGEQLDAAEALRKAQQWLANATAKELGLADRRGDSAEAFRAMRYYRANPLVKPFDHPYYWAGFVFSGAFA